MGTHLRVLGKKKMNTDMTGFTCFQRSLSSFALDELDLSIERVNVTLVVGVSGPVKSGEIQEEVPAAAAPAAEVVDNQEQEQQGKAEIPAIVAEQQPAAAAAAEIVVGDSEPVQAAEPEEAKEEEL